MEFIKLILGSPFGSFGFIVSVLLGCGWLIHYVTKKTTQFTSKHDSLKDNVNNINGSLSGSITKIDNHIDEIRRDLSYLKGSIDIFKRDSPSVAKSHSPVSLTEIGEQLKAELKAEEVIKRNWEKIFADLEKNICNKNAYDIQQYCLEMSAVEPERFLGKLDLDNLKQFAYQKGNLLQYYSPIFGIIIRDKYLEIKGINVSDVDLHDPTHK